MNHVDDLKDHLKRSKHQRWTDFYRQLDRHYHTWEHTKGHKIDDLFDRWRAYAASLSHNDLEMWLKTINQIGSIDGEFIRILKKEPIARVDRELHKLLRGK